MSTVFNGSVNAGIAGTNTLSGDEAGAPAFGKNFTAAFSVGATAPNVEGGGGYAGTFTCPTSGGTLNLADSTNICKTGAVGTIKPFQGYVITAVKRLRALYLRNLDTANTVTVTCPATLFLAGVGWVASQVVVTLQPGGAAEFLFPTGSAVLTAGTNDALLFTSSAGTPTVEIAGVFG